MRRDFYDLSRHSSRAAALEAELNCSKANIGLSAAAPVQSDDIPPPAITTAVQLSPSRPVTPNVVQRPDITDTLTSSSYAVDVNADYGYYATDTSTLRPPFLSSEIHETNELTAQYMPPFLSSEVDESAAQCMSPQPSGLVRPRRRLPHLPVAAATDQGYLRHESDTLSRRPVAAFSRFLPEPASTQSTAMTSVMPPRTPTFLDPPARDDALISAFSRQPEHTFSRSASAVTSMLPCQLANAPTRPPPVDDVMTSMVPRPFAVPADKVMTSTALPRLPVVPTHDVMTSIAVTRPLAMPVDEMISALPRPPAMPVDHAMTSTALPRPPLMDDVLTSALFTEHAHIHTPVHTFPRPLELAGIHSTVPSALPPAVPGELPTGDDIMPRPAAPVDSSKLAYLPPPPPPHRQLLPLLSETIQTTASDYINTAFVPSLSAHAYANLPFHASVPCLPAIQPTVSTLAHAPTYVGAPQWSYTENSQSLPIAVEQAGFSNISRVDDSRLAAADSGVHYTICTPASTDTVRPIVTAYTSPLPSPSVHWRKRFAYDYIQPDTGIGASTHTVPARPQTSDTHTHSHIQNTVHLQTLSVGEGQSMTDFRPPQAPPPPSLYVPHSHMMPPQVPTVPSVVPPPPHLPVQVPISSSTETEVTYLHVPHTHTVFADVHAPFTHQPSDASANAAIVSSQPQPATVTTQSHSGMHTQSVTNPAVNFNALPTGLTANADTVVPPPTAMPPPMPPITVHSTPIVTVPQSFVQSVPTFIVKQPQMPKPYSGLTSYQSFKEHFERICIVNAWTSSEDKVQNLTLALEGPAAEILKDVNESSPTAYDEIWTLLACRFGQTDAPRDAMRRFDNRRQTDSESIPEYAQAFRVLHREAWPAATSSQRDSDLKRKFEDGVLQAEMSQFLRLHARDDDFATTVLKARQFVDASELIKPKKSVRIVTPKPSHDAQVHCTQVQETDQTLVKAITASVTDLFKQYMPMSASASDTRTRDSRSPGPRDNSRERTPSQAQSPKQRQQFNGRQPPNGRQQSHSPARFDRRSGQTPTPGYRPDSRQASQSPATNYRRSSFNNDNNSRWSFRRPDSFRNRPDRRFDYSRQDYSRQDYTRTDDSRPRASTPVDRRSDYSRQDYTRTDDQRPRAPTPVGRQSDSSSSSGRRGPGCYVCGAFNCHSRNHRPQSRDRRPDQYTPTSSVETNPFRQGSPRPPTPPSRRDSENDVWVSRAGNREPNNYNRPSSR